MSPSSPANPTVSTLEWISLALIAAIAVCAYGWTAAAGMGIIGFSDTAEYLYFTDFYRAQFTGQAAPHAVEYYATTRFPPLFPLVLAAFGGGTHALQWTQVLASAITLGMFVILWWWLRRETSSPVAAAVITLLVVLSPGLFLLSLKPASEPLAMGMTWLTFILAASSRSTADRYLLPALVAGLSALARSANIALIAAMPVWLLLQRADRKQWVTATLTAFTPFVLWMLYRRSLPEADSYLEAMTLSYWMVNLGGWPELLYLHPWTLFQGLTRNFDTTPDALSFTLVGILLLAAFYGGWLRARAKKLDACFIVLYLALILVWPYPKEAPRFMTFILPLLFLYALQGLQGLLGYFSTRMESKHAATALLTLIFSLASATTLWHFLDLATMTVDEELRAEQREQLYFLTPNRAAALRTAEGSARVRFAAQEAATRIPPGDCVYSTLPHLLTLRAPVRVVLYPNHLRADIPPEAQLRECNYFFVAGFSGITPGQRPFHLLQELQGWTSPVLVSEIGAAGSQSPVAALLVRDVPSPAATDTLPDADPIGSGDQTP